MSVHTHRDTIYITLEQQSKGGPTLKLYGDFGLCVGSVPLTLCGSKVNYTHTHTHTHMHMYVFFFLCFPIPLFHISLPSLESLTRSLIFYDLSHVS